MRHSQNRDIYCVTDTPFLQEISCDANLSWRSDRDDVALGIDELCLHVWLNLADSLDTLDDWVCWSGLERNWAGIAQNLVYCLRIWFTHHCYTLFRLKLAFDKAFR